MISVKLLHFKRVFIILSVLDFYLVSAQMDTMRYANITKIEKIRMLHTISNFTPAVFFDIKDAPVSSKCNRALKAFQASLKKPWTLSMLDASAKIPSGIFSGNIYNLGTYDECQLIQNVEICTNIGSEEITEEINGNYCLGKIIVKNDKTLIEIFWALCVPDACNANDLNKIASSHKVPISFTEEKCHSPAQDPEIDGGDIAVITFFAVIVAIMLLSSLYDGYVRYFELKAIHPVCLAFSVMTNGEKLISTKKSADQMECISGIRFISMMWVVLGHCFSNMAMMPITDATQILKFYNEPWTRIIRAATFSVDSFFLLSGVLIVYVHLKSSKNGQCFNIPMFYLHRYLRLTPALAVVLIVHLTILKHFGGGPYWDVMNLFCFDTCKKYWWSVLLYIQNYTLELCIGQSWYLSCDTQLFVISPLFLLPLQRWPKATLALTLTAAIASMCASFGIAWEYKIIDSNAILLAGQNSDVDHNFSKYYIQTHTRATPYFIGMIVGYFVYQTKMHNKKFSINIFVNMLLWACSIAVLATCVFYDNALETEYNRLQMSSYVALVRPAWSVGLAWIIFACVTGHGGPVNTILSMPLFQILSRFTYAMYLTHFTTILVVYLSTKHPVPFSTARTLFEYWSMICLVFAISVFWTLAFESPILIIEKIIFGRGASTKKPEITQQDVNNDKQIGTVIIMEADVQDKSQNGLHHRSINGVTNKGYIDNENDLKRTT